MCKKEFPANVEESILIHHVKTAHMNKSAQDKKKSVGYNQAQVYFSVDFQLPLLTQ